MQHRNLSYRRHWKRLVETHGALCFYCREELATCIDHVVPYAWDYDNSIENLVPACGLCNLTAGDKVFDSVEHKRQYILNHRRDTRRAICTCCMLPYEYRITSPSLFLCAECYDEEYYTNYAENRAWRWWLRALEDADILPEAHRLARREARMLRRRHVSKRQFAYMLIQAYESLECEAPSVALA